MPPHLVVTPGQFIEIVVRDADGGGAAFFVGTIEGFPKIAGQQVFRMEVVGKARPMTVEDE